MIADIREKASDLKGIYSTSFVDSPKKLASSLSFIERSTVMESFRENSFIQPMPEEEEEIADVEEEKEKESP